MNNLQIFNNKEFGEIRTILIENEVWFIGKDITTALGYSNDRKALQDNVDSEDRRLIQKSLGVTLEIPNRGITAINESGLYSLILSSKLPNARKFKKWVTSEVLPAIRETGSYGVPKTPSEQIQLIAQGYVELEQTVSNIKEDITDLKENAPLYGCEIEDVQKHVKKRVVAILGGKQSEAYRDKSIRNKTFSDIWTQIKREYGFVSTYKSIKRKYIDNVHNFIDCYTVPQVLEEEISNANAQVRMNL